jgi:hypothetical protein
MKIKTQRYVPVLYIMAACVLFSCTRKGNTGPAGQTGPPGPAFKGAISGFVSVYDQYGGKLFNGLKNIQLTLKGGATTLTDSNGHYIFENVATGTYTITVSGAGLGTTVASNVIFISDTLYKDIKLSALPTFNVNALSAHHTPGSHFDSLTISVDIDSRARNVIIFVNNNRLVGHDNYILSYVKTIPAGTINPFLMMLPIPVTDLNNANIFYGQEVYYAACSYVINDASVYEDITTGKNVYNAVGTAIIDSSVAP